MSGTNRIFKKWRWPGKPLRGQSAVEFALLLPVFMLLFMGIFQFARVAASWITLQYAAAEAARFAITGTDFNSGTQVRESDIVNVARTASLGINIISSAASNQAGFFEVTIRSSRSTGNPSEANDAGGPNDFVRITLHYNQPALQFIFGSRGYLPLTVSQLVLNERFARPTGLAGIVGTPQLPSTPVNTFTPTKTPSPIPPTPTKTPTNTPIPPTPTKTPTITPTPSNTPTLTPTVTPSSTPTRDPWCNLNYCNCASPSYNCRSHHCCG